MSEKKDEQNLSILSQELHTFNSRVKTQFNYILLTSSIILLNMSGFKYDQLEFDDEQEEIQHQKMLEKQKQFQENYDSVMKEDKNEEDHKPQKMQQPTPIIVQKQQLIKKEPSHKNIPIEQNKQPVKKETPKPPPVPKSVNKEQTKSKVIDQHIKLKSQLTELASKMDDIVERERQKRRQKLNARSEEEDERVLKLKNQLREQELQINKNKAAIQKLRKNLDYKYDVHKIVQKQNELKLLKQQIKELQKQKTYLVKINKEQKSAKDNQDSDLVRINDKMKAEISQLTQKNKSHIESINETEKQIRKLHENNITKEQKIKEIEQKIKSKKEVPQSSDLEYNISELNQKIKELQKQKEDLEVQGQERLNEITREKKRLKYEYDKKVSYLEQKQKQLKINKIQYQDIVRLINAANSSKPPKKEVNDQVISKTSEKRKVNKGGRERPKIPQKNSQQISESPVIHTQTKIDQDSTKGRKQKHEIGVGSDNAQNQYEDYTNAEFEEEAHEQATDD